MKIAFTRYPQGQPEETVWTQMPQCPAVGDSVAIDEFGRIYEVTHVRWVVDPAGTDNWQAELSVT